LAKDLNRYCTKEDIQKAKKDASCHNAIKPFIMKEKQIEYISMYHYMTVRIFKIQNIENRSAGCGVEQQELLFIAIGMQHGTATVEDGWEFLTEINMHLPCKY
jgi:hypothetical protein